MKRSIEECMPDGDTTGAVKAGNWLSVLYDSERNQVRVRFMSKVSAKNFMKMYIKKGTLTRAEVGYLVKYKPEEYLTDQELADRALQPLDHLMR